MATQFSSQLAAPAAPISGSLGDPSRAILGPKRDALLFWGAPLAAFLFVQLWLRGWDSFAPAAISSQAVIALFGCVSILTWAHLIAVVPRAYMNPEVFAAYRLRLTIVPILLLAALFLSHTVLVAAAVVAVFWDVHHSAMQNFGFTRIYDMKAGNAPNVLRTTDLRLNWTLYVGPLGAGAALAVHTVYFRQFEGTMLGALTSVPGVLANSHEGVRLAATLAYAGVIGWAVIDYARAMRAGYTLPAHKLATIMVTGAVSVLAWGFSPPLVALAAINLYHAVQYFALVWVKEGDRMRGKGTTLRAALLFALGCALFGLAYAAAVSGKPTLFVAPFIACSLLHFWYDSFVWSVRKKQV
ncbi:hypothetical protein [Sphingomonas soli]|uniref:hypothetical protein n=1 Tax=Sphingomonas soli TaxID=266127 RepID=UPI00082EFCE1|nr:hypothetical protein [Sphingomonas soli]